jgi:4-amino-4-deoxychorismate lyase
MKTTQFSRGVVETLASPRMAPACTTSEQRHAFTTPSTPRHARRSHRILAASSTAENQSFTSPLDNLLAPGTVPTRRLSTQEAMDGLYSSQHATQRTKFVAFYSSELGGIVTDPALMVVQLDDHMVHRGHAVFDTATMTEGFIYQLGPHVERFLASAARANIPLPPRTSPEQLVRIILETAAASQELNGHIRYFLSAGRGGFGLSSSECIHSSLYVIVSRTDEAVRDSEEHLTGWKVKTSPVPSKDPYFATLKSTNYLPNALAVIDAQAEGFDQGIFLDSNGNVAEGPNMNLGVILHDGTLIIPPFETSLPGITVRRALELAEGAMTRGILDGVAKIERRHIGVDEAKGAAEVFLVGSTLPVMSVVKWDDKVIGDGQPGIASLQLRALVQGDMMPREDSDQHTEIPYGYLTGMGA